MARPSIASERREQIMDAFEICVARNGIQGTRLADVAEESGLPRPLVRHFIGNRQDMTEALVDRFVQRGKELWRDIEDRDLSIDEMVEFLVRDALVSKGVGALAREIKYQRNFDVSAARRFKRAMERVQQYVEQVLKKNGFDDATERREKAFAVLAIALGANELVVFGLPKARLEASIKACKQILERR